MQENSSPPNAEDAPSSPIIDNEDVAAGSPPPTPSQVSDASSTSERTVEEVISAEIHKSSRAQTPSTTQSAFAAGVAKEILNDFLDEDQQLLAASGVIAIFVLVLWRRLSAKIANRAAAQVMESLRDAGVI